MINRSLIIIFVLMGIHIEAGAQQLLGLQDMIELAKEKTIDAQIARKNFDRASWAYKQIQSVYYPKIDFAATLPDFNRSLTRITLDDGSDQFVQRRINNTYGNLTLRQQIPQTGTSINMNTDFQRIDLFSGAPSYLVSPFSISIQQEINGFNAQKWNLRIGKLNYEQARSRFIEEMETVNLKTVDVFYDRISAELKRQIAQMNYANSDTLYKIAKGRYEKGTIARDEVMNMELNLLNAQASLNTAVWQDKSSKKRLLTYLRMDTTNQVELLWSDSIIKITPNSHVVYQKAIENNVQSSTWELQKVQTEMQLERVKRDNSWNTRIAASYGMNYTDTVLNVFQQEGQANQQVSVGLVIPLFGGFENKAAKQIARLDYEIAGLKIEQEQEEYYNQINELVANFSNMVHQVELARKQNEVAKIRYEITKQRFIIGRVDILVLNNATVEQDAAQRNLINSYHDYWRLYYQLRRITHWNFASNNPINH